MAASKVHRPLQGGICGGKDGAESIVVSGGYVDDEDYGDEIVYTGQGGNDPSTKRQVAHQELTLGNAGLAVLSRDVGQPGDGW
ncbi:YDG/SRA domain-containing protein [Micromonospora halotolerans]|uniref:YDG/SRA domain-containing protein n=1 Tax=Micromonospora halotolerans TaxID=709879 RepID=A0ABZ0A193_9ACTN|nr:YDG/SRA domain-containing protein [Micromonospora halotolerans]WNM40917.1 YDG/SRA domain-containing protein [Micromonospora halotolerans]